MTKVVPGCWTYTRERGFGGSTRSPAVAELAALVTETSEPYFDGTGFVVLVIHFCIRLYCIHKCSIFHYNSSGSEFV